MFSQRIDRQRLDARPKVLPFYGHSPEQRFGSFSNFHYHREPYEFTLPQCVLAPGFPPQIRVSFSEAAIMACKAALFRDEEAFREVCAANDPAKAKKIGRGVRDFDQERWDAVIEEVAYEVVVQKFRADQSLETCF
jgi:ribA/ribD-fused uncharacterized protein